MRMSFMDGPFYCAYSTHSSLTHPLLLVDALHGVLLQRVARPDDVAHVLLQVRLRLLRVVLRQGGGRCR